MHTSLQQARAWSSPWPCHFRPGVSMTWPLRSRSCDSIIRAEQAPSDADRAILLQGFGWESCKHGAWYDHVRSKVRDLQQLGVTHIWLPPPSQSVADQGYLPAQLYNLNSKYGTKESLQHLTWDLNHAGIRPIADVVINHRCADVQDENGIYNTFRDDVDHKGRRMDWGAWAVCSDDVEYHGKGAKDTGAAYGPAPDLDHSNEELRGALKEWLCWLKGEVGLQGWRFDFVKGYAPCYVKEYVEASGCEDGLNVAEFWVDMRWDGASLCEDQNAPRQVLCDWIKASGEKVLPFDFPTKGILQEAVKHTQYWRLRDREGRAPGLLGYWPRKASLFVDNHDSGSTPRHWPFPDSHLSLGYAYILCSPGVPCLFWEHVFHDEHLGRAIAELVALRRKHGIHAGSRLVILRAEWDQYVASTDDRLMLKLGPRREMGDLLPKEPEWGMAAKGHDWAVWERIADALQKP